MNNISLPSSGPSWLYLPFFWPIRQHIVNRIFRFIVAHSWSILTLNLSQYNRHISRRNVRSKNKKTFAYLLQKVKWRKNMYKKKCECAIKNVNTKPKTNGQSFCFCYRFFCFFFYRFFYCFYIFFFFYIFLIFFYRQNRPKMLCLFWWNARIDKSNDNDDDPKSPRRSQIKQAKRDKDRQRERQRKTPKWKQAQQQVAVNRKKS